MKFTRQFASVSMFVVPWLLSACSTVSFGVVNLPARFSSTHRLANLSFGPEAWQRLDVYLPPERPSVPKPVIVFWYGGGWTQGSKNDYRFVGAALAGLSYVTIVPNYRLYPQVRFPVFIEDGATAVAWVQAHAAEYGGDPRRIVLMGHSAGAHQAAMLALNREYLLRAGADPQAILGFIGLSGPYELVPNSPTLNAIFAPPYTPSDWQVLPFVSASAPPCLLIHGGADKVVWVTNSEHLAAALTARDVRADLRIYPNRGHADTVAAISPLLRFRAPAFGDIETFLRSLSVSE